MTLRKVFYFHLRKGVYIPNTIILYDRDSGQELVSKTLDLGTYIRCSVSYF